MEYTSRLIEQVEALLISSFSIDETIHDKLIDAMILVWFAGKSLALYGNFTAADMHTLYDQLVDVEDIDEVPAVWIQFPGMDVEYHYESVEMAFAAVEEFYDDLMEFTPPLNFINNIIEEHDLGEVLENQYASYFNLGWDSNAAKWFIV